MSPLVNVISAAFALLSREVKHVLPPGVLQSFVKNGVLSGVGSVLVFLPQNAVPVHISAGRLLLHGTRRF